MLYTVCFIVCECVLAVLALYNFNYIHSLYWVHVLARFVYLCKRIKKTVSNVHVFEHHSSHTRQKPRYFYSCTVTLSILKAFVILFSFFCSARFVSFMFPWAGHQFKTNEILASSKCALRSAICCELAREMKSAKRRVEWQKCTYMYITIKHQTTTAVPGNGTNMFE